MDKEPTRCDELHPCLQKHFSDISSGHTAVADCGMLHNNSPLEADFLLVGTSSRVIIVLLVIRNRNVYRPSIH